MSVIKLLIRSYLEYMEYIKSLYPISKMYIYIKNEVIRVNKVKYILKIAGKFY